MSQYYIEEAKSSTFLHRSRIHEQPAQAVSGMKIALWEIFCVKSLSEGDLPENFALELSYGFRVLCIDFIVLLIPGDEYGNIDSSPYREAEWIPGSKLLTDLSKLVPDVGQK